MRHQLGEGQGPKKEQKRNVEAGFEAWKLWAQAVEDDDIDPADFIDPEEFTYGRGGSLARP